MSSELRVCQLITGLGYGGAENMVVDLVDAVDDVTFSVGYMGQEDALAAEILTTGVSVHALGERIRFDPTAFARLVRLFRRVECDVVHLHLPYAQTVGRLAAALAGIDGVVSTQHNVPSNYHPVTRTTERLTRCLDDVTVAVSQGVERAFTGTAHVPGKSDDDWCTIYNGIDVDGFERSVREAVTESVEESFGIDGNETVFLSVGRYVPVKRQEMLIEAFEQSGVDDGRLFLVGHGPREATLRDAVRDRGLSERVHVTGRVPTVEPYYALADVFVSASGGEGLPITFLEAMAAGLPVIGTQIAGVDEVVVENETGYLCRQDANAIGAAMAKLCDPDRQQSLGGAGRRRVAAHFSIEQMAGSYADLYRCVVSK